MLAQPATAVLELVVPLLLRDLVDREASEAVQQAWEVRAALRAVVVAEAVEAAEEEEEVVVEEAVEAVVVDVKRAILRLDDWGYWYTIF